MKKPSATVTKRTAARSASLACTFAGATAAAALSILTGCGVVTVRTAGTTTASPSPHPAGASSAHTTAASPGQAAGAHASFVTVMDRFPEMTEGDALDLAKVKGVIDRAPADMFYSAAPCGSRSPLVYVPPSSAGTRGAATADPDSVGVDSAQGSPERPYATVWNAQGTVRLGQRDRDPVALNTPVLVWRVDHLSVLAVTLDGGMYSLVGIPYSGGEVRFECNKSPMLAPGVKGALPPPVQHYVVTSQQIKLLEAAGQMPAGSSQKIEDARNAASACTDKLWAQRFAARDRANDVADIGAITRQNRKNQIQGEYQEAFPKTCAAEKKKFDDLYAAAIEANKQRRLALYQSVVAKVTAMASAP